MPVTPSIMPMPFFSFSPSLMLSLLLFLQQIIIIIVLLFEQVLHNAPPVQHFSPQHLPYVIIITTCISHVYLYLLLSYTIILHYIHTCVREASYKRVRLSLSTAL